MTVLLLSESSVSELLKLTIDDVDEVDELTDDVDVDGSIKVLC